MKTIIWKLYLKSDTKTVYSLISTSEGRKKFWSEEASVEGNKIHFVFPNGQTYNSQIIKKTQNKEYHLDYFDSLVKFNLKSTKNGGTGLTLINENIPESDFCEVKSGWVSVLMNLKAVADFQCDLRNHDEKKTWDQLYINN